MLRRAAIATLLAVLAGCQSAETNPSDPVSAVAGSSSATPATATATAIPSASVSATAPAASASPSGAPAIALQRVADDLLSPINVEATPDGWLLVNERDGRVIAVRPDGSGRGVAVDLTDRVAGGGERGLLGLALHPEWPDVPRAFVHYSAEADGGTVVSELSADPGDGDTPPTFDPASETVLLTEAQPYPNHNGGQLAFGSDGYLYLGLGDGGAGGDPLNHGQDPTTLLGSILRLDVATAGVVAIPPDNPFADGVDGAPEVFLYGLRNPWRFSFDELTGLLWVADVGQNAFEEIDRIDPAQDAGANLGWNVMEASHCFLEAGCSQEGMTMPVAEYPRELGCSVTGGYVYRGSSVASLAGWYVFGDYCQGTIFGLPAEVDTSETPVAPTALLESGLEISTFGEGPDGELYVADLREGVLYRIVAP